MKELSIEQKAKRYDEAVINGSRLWESGIIARENYEYIFPELKENEDERIREEIKVVLANTDLSRFALNYTFADMLTWLEKQGKKQIYQSNERAWLYLVADVLTWREGIGQYLDDPRVQELAKKNTKRIQPKVVH